MSAILQTSPAPRAIDQIFHLRAATLPEFRFEWHQVSRRVYVIDVRTEQPIGDPIADRIADDRSARTAVVIWCHGYRTGKARVVA